MDDKIKKFDTPEKCEKFAKNCINLAQQARERAVQLRAVDMNQSISRTRMNKKVKNIKTPEECELFAEDCIRQAQQARERAVQLRAGKHGAETPAEYEALAAVYAYETVLYAKHGKHIRASYTRRMIKKHGIIAAVERAVNRKTETQGYTSLVEMGLGDYAFENVVLRHPNRFSKQAVSISRERMEQNNHE